MRTTCPLMRNLGQATSPDTGRRAGKAGGGGLGEGDQIAQGGIEGVLEYKTYQRIRLMQDEFRERLEREAMRRLLVVALLTALTLSTLFASPAFADEICPL
jgi:hypothetical protein